MRNRSGPDFWLGLLDGIRTHGAEALQFAAVVAWDENPGVAA